MSEFIHLEPLSDVDPEVDRIIALEAERQQKKLIFIPSESKAPFAVRESLGSILQNFYAEGYPNEETRKFSQEEILDVDAQITHFRRYSDPRYYKGVEYADILEELARRRCAELFATKEIPADNIYVNVQPLSGAPANNAVYHALIDPGDSVIGMNLFHGGHLTHGSSVNRSGKVYNVSHYSVDPETEKINYETLRNMVNIVKPKILIAGYSSYPWVPDWKTFSEIAKSVGAYFFADISHIAGMVAAGVIPSPVGYADIITFTTHKTLCGPRGAVILSFSNKTSRLIDKAVFPGEQGGPHINVFAAMATSFKLAKTKQFEKFQTQIVKNAKTLCDQISNRGIRIAFRGTNTHLFNIDCKSIIGKDGTTLSGDMAARIFDIAGLVMNANTIPGDKSALRSSGVRIGTPWLTQRGLVEADMIEIGNIISDLLHATEPYTVPGKRRSITRAKIDFQTLETAKLRVRDLINKTVDGAGELDSGYPNYYYINDYKDLDPEKYLTFEIFGDDLIYMIEWVFSLPMQDWITGKTIRTSFSADGQTIPCYLKYIGEGKAIIALLAKHAGLGITWLRDLSDGFIKFDEDVKKKIPGPFIIKQSVINLKIENSAKEDFDVIEKPFFIGIKNTFSKKEPLPNFDWHDADDNTLKRTKLFDTHKELGAKIIPFAGWEMPVWYTSVSEEHKATRSAAGLFDVSHMGVFEASGNEASIFLDCVCGNDISALDEGESCYTHFLDIDGKVIDDLLVYRHAADKYLIVVNASNKSKDWAWLNAVKAGSVCIDKSLPWVKCPGSNVTLIDLQDEQAGNLMRVDIALQGQKSLDILLKLLFNAKDKAKLKQLKRTQLCHATWKENDLIISRTGYTGEKMAFEIFIHPDASIDLWNELLKVGTPVGLKPCGLGARDSLRTEAGLPLYGHEMGGMMNLGAAEAGFGSYIKTYKPWFIGRTAFLENETTQKRIVARFQFEEKRTRMAHLGDLVFNDRGKHIGYVTSCAIDTDEFLTGQAIIDIKSAREDETIYIYQNTRSVNPIDFSQISDGSKINIPSKATILSRFPRL